MNKRSLILGSAVLVLIALIMIACASPGSGSSLFTSPIITPAATTTVVEPPIVTEKDVTTTFELGNPAKENEPIPITITIESRVALSDAKVTLTVKGPSINRTDPPRSLGDLKSNNPKQITTTLALSSEAQYFIKIHLFTPEGFHMSDSTRVWVSKTEVVSHPTPAYGPGTPAPAAQDKSQATAGPTVTPSSLGASPTPQ